jgi:hypothetical protein
LGAFLRADGNLFPDHESLHRCLAVTEIQKLPSFSMTGATSRSREFLGWKKCGSTYPQLA